MISKKLINRIVSGASQQNLKDFAVIAINSLIRQRPWNDEAIMHSLELISGCSDECKQQDIDMVKLKEYIHKDCYKGENCENFRIDYIDNFTCEVYVSYQQDGSEEINSTTTISFRDILKQQN